MDYEEEDELINKFLNDNSKDNTMYYLEDYNRDWENLHRVLEEILEIDNQADEEMYNAIGYKDLDIIHNTSILCPIHEVYKRILEYIKWINKYNGI